MVEPIAGVLGAAGVTLAAPVLPYALAFAAGAMIYVVIDDIIPEAYQRYVHRIINCPVENSRLLFTRFLSPFLPLSLSLSLSLSLFFFLFFPLSLGYSELRANDRSELSLSLGFAAEAASQKRLLSRCRPAMRFFV